MTAVSEVMRKDLDVLDASGMRVSQIGKFLICAVLCFIVLLAVIC